MKQLILIRHAKSSWDDLRQPDHDRPLNERGKRDAPVMATWLSSQIESPDFAIISTAVRARDTAENFVNVFDIPQESIVRTRDVYGAGLEELTDQISWLPPASAERVMVIGHNPTMTLAADMYAGGGIDNMPTCAVAVIEFPKADTWKDLGEGKLLHFKRPKDLRES